MASVSVVTSARDGLDHEVLDSDIASARRQLSSVRPQRGIYRMSILNVVIHMPTSTPTRRTETNRE